MEAKTMMLLMFFVSAVVIDACYMRSHDNKASNTGDTLIRLNNGIYYKLIFSGDTAYSVTWGNKNFSSTSKLFEVTGNDSLELLDYTDTCILLGQRCGTSCASYVFLPVIPNATERRYLFGKAYNLLENTVAFIPDSESLISVQNYLTNKSMDIQKVIYALRLLKETVSIAVKSKITLYTFTGKEENGLAINPTFKKKNTR